MFGTVFRGSLTRRATLAAVIVSGLILATARAAIADAGPFTFPFHDCVGPSGTPPSFTAEKTQVAPAAGGFALATGYRLTDGTRVFIALIRGDIFGPPGIDVSGNVTTTCLVDTPLFGTVEFRGFLTPAH